MESVRPIRHLEAVECADESLLPVHENHGLAIERGLSEPDAVLHEPHAPVSIRSVIDVLITLHVLHEILKLTPHRIAENICPVP